jgi:nucleotide-binding universal stress UspA family protein
MLRVTWTPAQRLRAIELGRHAARAAMKATRLLLRRERRHASCIGTCRAALDVRTRTNMAMNDSKTLLVALDFSPHSDAALTETLGLADLIDARVHVLHVFTLEDQRETVPTSRNLYTHLKTSRRTQLEAAAARCRAKGRLGTLLWSKGDPAAQILLTADAIAADMIVVGASGRNMLTRLRLGSVAEAVVRRAECTVIVVRHKTGANDDN